MEIDLPKTQHLTDDEDQKTLSGEKHEPGETSRWESVRLVCTAILVCLTLGASFLAADTYNISPGWVFFSWNSIWLFLILWKGFRRHFKNAQFTAFFLMWTSVHGTVVVLLMRWVRMLYWIPLIALELFVGFLAANLLFGIVPDRKK
jgi:hypothetical protein